MDSFADDTYISLQYARNLVHGNGLVFNLGERVEGFTHPLWVFVEAAAIGMRLPIRTALQGISVAAWIGAAVSASRAARDAGVTGWTLWSPGIVVAATAHLGFWSLSGLETAAYAFALAEGVRLVLAADRDLRPRSLRTGFVFGVAGLLRPDAVLVFAVAWPWVVARFARRREWTLERTATEGALGMAGILALLGPWQIFRLAYYGAWLPNTYYAKMEFSRPVALKRGLTYLVESAGHGPVFLMIAGIILLWRMRRFEVRLPATVAAAHLAYVAWVGGDYMDFERFVVPLVAPLAIALAVSAAVVGRVTWRARGCVAAAVAAALSPYVVSPKVTSFTNATIRFLPAARWLREHTPAGALVASPAAGAIAYVGGVRVLDEFGLTDAYVARHVDPRLDPARIQALAGHSRGNARYVLERRPDAILVANVWVYRKPLTPELLASHLGLMSVTDRLLFSDDSFFKAYDVLNFRLPDGYCFGLAVRKDSPMHPAYPSYRGPQPI
jgi:hypothetical protein